MGTVKVYNQKHLFVFMDVLTDTSFFPWFLWSVFNIDIMFVHLEFILRTTVGAGLYTWFKEQSTGS